MSPGTGGVDRATFLARIAAALNRRAAPVAPPPPPIVVDSIARVTGADEDLASIFAARAAEAGMVVHRVLAAGAHVHVVGLLSMRSAKRVAVADVPALEGLAAALQSAGVELLTRPSASGLEGLYQTDAGITDVQAAIAETGTLVCWSGPTRGRGLSLVPPVHVAIVRRSDIVADLIDYLACHALPEALPSSIVLITGPSKTADIEGVLITGVHGPREVHIVLIEDA